jgi:4-aminobutyrate aminotransferase-like enzyme
VRGEGTWLFDADGRRYLDCYNNVASVGHCHPHVVAALSRQAATLNTHTRYLHDNVVRYAERLTATMPEPLRVCYFVCTGTEAIDLAIRIARSSAKKEGVIVSDDSYHGNSNVVGTASTCMYPKEEQPAWLATVPPPNGYRGEYRYGTPDLGRKYAALHRPGDREAARAQAGRRGVGLRYHLRFQRHDPVAARLSRIHRRGDPAAGGLFIADEVQSGFYRTGERCGRSTTRTSCPTSSASASRSATATDRRGDHDARDRREVRGEVLLLQHLRRQPGLRRRRHGRARRAGARGIQQNVIAAGKVLEAGLAKLAAKYPLVADVRGKGLFWGLEIVRDHATRAPAVEEADRIMNLLREDGFLLGRTGAFDNVIKIRPPLVVYAGQCEDAASGDWSGRCRGIDD